MSQKNLFIVERPSRPRKKPCKRGTLMHVCDAGGMESMMVRMECPSCQHVTDWVEVRTVSEAKRGRPCPKCNPESAT